MSTTTSTPTLHRFILWAPDYTDEGAFARRLSVRPAHLENAHKLINAGILRAAGGCLTPESILPQTENRKFVGSCMIYEAESLEAARQLVEEDEYYKNGVWDKEKMVLLPIWLATELAPVPSSSSS